MQKKILLINGKHILKEKQSSFNIVDDYFIGFDKLKWNSENYNAAFKVRITSLIETLTIMKNINCLQDLYKIVLEKLGYTIKEEKLESTFGNLFVEKNQYLYCLKFADFKGRYIEQQDLQKVVDDLSNINKTNFIYILVVDCSYTNKKINAYLQNEHILILDKKYIKEMLGGRDILEEITNSL